MTIDVKPNGHKIGTGLFNANPNKQYKTHYVRNVVVRQFVDAVVDDGYYTHPIQTQFVELELTNRKSLIIPCYLFLHTHRDLFSNLVRSFNGLNEFTYIPIGFRKANEDEMNHLFDMEEEGFLGEHWRRMLIDVESLQRYAPGQFIVFDADKPTYKHKGYEVYLLEHILIEGAY